MRIGIGTAVLALVALRMGLAAALLLILLGVIDWPTRMAAGLVIGVALFACPLTAYHAMYTVRELLKQVALWLGIVVLLPLVAWFGTSAFHPPPDPDRYVKPAERVAERIKDTKDETQKEQLRDEKDRLDREREEAWRAYYRAMFWVAYPVGLVAVIVGTFVGVQVVGSALMYGGLASLTTGCYSYWDRMDGWLRFGSLLVALAVLLALGIWRFRPRRSDGLPTAEPAAAADPARHVAPGTV